MVGGLCSGLITQWEQLGLLGQGLLCQGCGIRAGLFSSAEVCPLSVDLLVCKIY